MATHAKGTFEVKVTPQAQEENVGVPTVTRLSLDKQYHGELEASIADGKHSYEFEYSLA
jgi:hypothetical protein